MMKNQGSSINVVGGNGVNDGTGNSNGSGSGRIVMILDGLENFRDSEND